MFGIGFPTGANLGSVWIPFLRPFVTDPQNRSQGLFSWYYRGTTSSTPTIRMATTRPTQSLEDMLRMFLPRFAFGSLAQIPPRPGGMLMVILVRVRVTAFVTAAIVVCAARMVVDVAAAGAVSGGSTNP